MSKRIKEELGRRKIDNFTFRFKEDAEKRGKPITTEQARQKAVEVAIRAERKLGAT